MGSPVIRSVIGRAMEKVFMFCLFCWSGGGILLLAALLDWRLSHIRDIVDFKHGRLVSRLLVGGFGLCAIGIGTLLRLAMNA